MTPQEAKAYFQELARKAGLDPSVSLSQVLENENFLKETGNGIARHSEYSSALDRARALEQERNQAKEQLGTWDAWYKNYAEPKVSQAEQREKQLQDYVNRYGQLPDGTQTGYQGEQVVAGMTKAEIEKMLKERDSVRDQAYTTMTKQVTRVMARHLKDFNEDLDIDAVEKLMDEKRLPLEAAYKEYIGPRVEERKKTQDEEWRKKTTEEIERDVRSRYKIPVDAKPRESVSDLLNRKAPDGIPEEQGAKNAFMEAWNERETSV